MGGSVNFALTETRDLPQQEWDVVVIGAGVAGSVAARQCAQRGLKTLLVDGRAFPRPKVCGGCLNSRAVHVLEQIGFPRLSVICEVRHSMEFHQICEINRILEPPCRHLQHVSRWTWLLMKLLIKPALLL